MNKTKIPWCDYTWNPITGCSPASEGCEHCYASALSHRFHRPFDITFHPDRLKEPRNLKKPSKIFVCSMSDLFHEQVTKEQLHQVLFAAEAAPWHTYLFLTKRPHNMPEFIPTPANWWFGITAENQKRFNMRWPVLCEQTRRNRFVSVEPMLEPVSCIFGDALEQPDWVIAGPENGPEKRTFDPKWIKDLAADCAAIDVPFFDKCEKPIRREFPFCKTKQT